MILSSVAYAEDPLPPEEQPIANDPGEPSDPYVDDKPAPPEVPAPPEAPTKHARVASRVPRATERRVEDDPDAKLDKREDTVLDGKHFRVKTAQGAVHVWVPPDYDRETAGTVVYVHGYYTDADGAWRDHELARQFKKSHQNAMFIVPDAPKGNDEHVMWPALTDLRRAMTRANIKLPEGPIIVMGHSGAFRTVMQWVDHRMVDQIILLDALYAGEQAFDEFIASGKRADDHKLIVVGAGTAEESSVQVRGRPRGHARQALRLHEGRAPREAALHPLAVRAHGNRHEQEGDSDPAPRDPAQVVVASRDDEASAGPGTVSTRCVRQEGRRRAEGRDRSRSRRGGERRDPR
jgi:hypothetical protein